MSRQKQRQFQRQHHRTTPTPPGLVRVNVEALAPYNSYGTPSFVARGYYEDIPFTCSNCGAAQIWRAAQQKWWYEVAKGNVESTAKLCRACRRREQARREEARRVHREGLARKRGRGV
ncbi:MAG TPA: zinc-ribbon domain containing protein [Burkholderiales bacterium]|nr:zinc-ribbon domain containing protein [Burkholderiales bacterium]